MILYLSVSCADYARPRRHSLQRSNLAPYGKYVICHQWEGWTYSFDRQGWPELGQKSAFS